MAASGPGWYWPLMQDEESTAPSEAEAGQLSSSVTRAERIRERLRQAQFIAAQAARARAAGGQPSDDEAARLVAEFHARGGQVTVCPPVDETQDSIERNQREAGRRGSS